jgi:hypothetical protein
MPPGNAVEPLARHGMLLDRMRALASGLLGRGVSPPRVRERVADELHDGGAGADATLAALSGRFGDAAMIEMLVIVGFCHLRSFVANGARVELEPWGARFPAA